MAIDRTVKWRCQWQGKNGWANMLEIIPAGDWIDSTTFNVTSFSRAAFEMDFAEFGFDDLPIGMMKSQAASFSFKWENLPSGLQELLKTPRYTPAGYDQETTTLFTYWNDEGTNTLRLQYVGAQSNKMGNKFQMVGSAVVGDVTIETFDLLKTILDTRKSNSIFTANSGSVSFPAQATHDLTGGTDIELVDFSDDTRWKIDYPISFRYHFLFYSIANFRNYFGAFINTHIIYWCRSGIGGGASCTQTNYPDISLTLYKQTRTDAHTKGAALDETTTLILGHVTEGTAYTSLGGFFSNDKEGVGEFDSMSTFIAALCENFVCKLIFKPITQTVAAETLITYDLYWLRPLDSVGTPVTLSAKITADSYSITTAEKLFLIAETEIPNMGGDDINMSRVSTTVSDKTDTWSTKAILHNLPTKRSGLAGTTINADPFNKYTLKINPRKLYYRDTSSYYSTLKVHESVTISDGTNTKTLDTPIAFQNENWYDGVLDGWVLATQQTQGLPQAIAEYITTYWSNPNQALREFPCKMVNAEITPSLIGDLFTLPAITDIGAGATSILLSGKPDWDLGVMDCKFLSLP